MKKLILKNKILILIMTLLKSIKKLYNFYDYIMLKTFLLKNQDLVYDFYLDN